MSIADVTCTCLLSRFPKARFGHEDSCAVTSALYLERYGPQPAPRVSARELMAIQHPYSEKRAS